MIPLLPVAIAGLALVSYKVSRKRDNRGMTAERQIIYDNAIRSLKDPVKLRTLAASFESAGLKPHAQLLLKRAKLRELPPEVKAARDKIYRAAFKSTDPIAINKLADAFAQEGATNAAEKLREYAAGLTDESVIDNTVTQPAEAPMTADTQNIPEGLPIPEEPLPTEIPIPDPDGTAEIPVEPIADPVDTSLDPEPESQSPGDEVPDPNA